MLAKTLKLRRDAERRLELTSPRPVFNGGAADSIEGGGNETIVNFNGHTHDERYYTETEVDTMLSAALAYYEPLTNGDETTPEVIFHNGDILMGVA